LEDEVDDGPLVDDELDVLPSEDEVEEEPLEVAGLAVPEDPLPLDFADEPSEAPPLSEEAVPFRA
jgi:hypothetical protein